MPEPALSSRAPRHPAISFCIILLMFALGSYIVGPMIGLLLADLAYPGDMTKLSEAMTDPVSNPGIKVPLFITQGVAQIVGMILTPLVFLRMESKSFASLFPATSTGWTPVLLVPMIMITFIGADSIVAEWNANLQFPEFAKELEVRARALEDSIAEMVKTMLNFEAPGDLWLAILVIALIPAIGEELVFRGIIQNQFRQMTGNRHAAVWIAALLFSAIHFQFFGFVPRFLLGALIGYLYAWSGNLILSMLAHFINNATLVILFYYSQKGTLTIDMESPEALPASIVITSTALAALLLYYFYRYFKDRNLLYS